VAVAAGVRLVEKAWGWSRRRVACAAGSWLGQEACGWSSRRVTGWSKTR
jgi:hypothetical protein